MPSVRRRTKVEPRPWLVKEPPASETDGYRVIAFVEAFCRHTRGPRAGKLIVLRPFQRRLILELFRVDADGKRIYRRGLWGMARKNGKSMLGACIALYCLVADGVMGAEVYSVAGDRDQARIVFDEAMQMVRLEPELAAQIRVREAASTLLHPASGSIYRAIASDSATAEGLNPSCVIFDEVHVQKTSRLWSVMVNGSGARDKAIVLGITTAGDNLNTLCGRLYKAGRAGNVPAFHFVWIEPAVADCNWLDESVWLDANPGMDFQSIDDFRASAAEAKARGAENEFRRYRLNQWTGSVEAWLPYGAWSKLADPSCPIEDGENVVLGFDGSFSGDSTALVACTTDRPLFYLQPVELWERTDGDGDWRVPIADVEASVVAACKRFRVREVACDPFRWQRSMQVLQDAGIPIVEWPTTSIPRMVKATAAFADLVASGELRHNGDENLARHLANCRIRADAKGPRLVKETPMSGKRIDLAVAAVIALDRALQPVESAEYDGNIW